MFKVQSFQYYLDNRCRPYIFWDVCPQSSVEQIWSLCSKWLSCSSCCGGGCLPYIYWMVLGLSITGAWQSLQECIRVINSASCSATPTMWRPRKLYVIPDSILSKTRVIGSIFMTYTWMLMIYALVTISPEYMMPWIVINSLMLLADSVLWISEMLTGHCALDLRAVIALGRLACTLLLVNSVRNAFEYAIMTNRVHSLRKSSMVSILG